VLVLAGSGCEGCGKDTPLTCPEDPERCDTEDTVDSDTEIVEGCGAGDCSVAIRPLLPANDATDVDYRTPFAVEFTADEHATAVFALHDADGADVPLGPVSWSTNGKQASFAATAPLTPATAYTLDVTTSCTCDTPTPIRFTTSATGTPVGDPAAFLGQTYAIDLATATILEPAGVDSLLGALLEDLDQTLAVVPDELGEDGKLSFYGGLAADDGSQDACTPTLEFPQAADFEDPYFAIAAPDGITLDVAGVEITLLALDLSGSFSPDASAIEGLTLAGRIDTRALVDVLGDNLGGATGDDAVCNLVGTFTNNAVQCSDCGDGHTPYCLELVAANLVADAVDWDLEVITAEQVAANEACAGAN
jgi:hypothetical protein